MDNKFNIIIDYQNHDYRYNELTNSEGHPISRLSPLDEALSFANMLTQYLHENKNINLYFLDLGENIFRNEFIYHGKKQFYPDQVDYYMGLINEDSSNYPPAQQKKLDAEFNKKVRKLQQFFNGRFKTVNEILVNQYSLAAIKLENTYLIFTPNGFNKLESLYQKVSVAIKVDASTYDVFKTNLEKVMDLLSMRDSRDIDKNLSVKFEMSRQHYPNIVKNYTNDVYPLITFFLKESAKYFKRHVIEYVPQKLYLKKPHNSVQMGGGLFMKSPQQLAKYIVKQINLEKQSSFNKVPRFTQTADGVIKPDIIGIIKYILDYYDAESTYTSTGYKKQDKKAYNNFMMYRATLEAVEKLLKAEIKAGFNNAYNTYKGQSGLSTQSDYKKDFNKKFEELDIEFRKILNDYKQNTTELKKYAPYVKTYTMFIMPKNILHSNASKLKENNIIIFYDDSANGIIKSMKLLFAMFTKYKFYFRDIFNAFDNYIINYNNLLNSRNIIANTRITPFKQVNQYITTPITKIKNTKNKNSKLILNIRKRAHTNINHNANKHIQIRTKQLALKKAKWYNITTKRRLKKEISELEQGLA